MKLTKFTKSLVVFAMALLATVCIGAGTTKAQEQNRLGYISSVSNLQMTATDKHSLTMSWQPSDNATSYNVYYRDYYSQGDYILAGNTTATSYTLTGLTDGMRFDINVRATNGAEESSGRRCYDAFTLPETMTGLQQEKWWYFAKTLDVKWDRKSGADGVEITLYDDKGKKVSSKTLSAGSTSTSFYNMKDKVYTVKARCYKTYNGTTYYSSTASIKCLNQARIKKIGVKNNKLTLSWGKVSGATGYQIFVSTKPNSGYKKVATVSKKKSSYTVKKFKGKKFSSKKTYYVYVKTVCNKGKSKNTSGVVYYWNSKTGSWSWINN